MKINYRIAIFAIYLFWGMLFFSLCSVLGIKYGEDEMPPLYSVGILLTVVLTVIALGRSIFSLIRENSLFTFVFPLFVTLCFLYDSFTSRGNLTQYFVYYVAFCIPSTYVGVYLAKNGGISTLGKWLDIVMIICSMGVLRALPDIIYNSVISLGGASYQQLSYMSGLAFCINLCGLFLGDRYDRFPFMQSLWGRILSIVLLLIQLLGCLYSGGRGGFVYLALTAAFLFVYSKRSRNLLYLVAFILIFVFISTQFRGSIFYDVIGVRMERTFSFITEGGEIDTQNRNEVWNGSITMINNNNSAFGYGLFHYYYIILKTINQPYAHNMFLDFMLQGGILYLSLWTILLFVFVRRFYYILKYSKSQVLLIPLAFYIFVELLFSSTYLRAGLMWLTLAYVFSYYSILKRSHNKIV